MTGIFKQRKTGGRDGFTLIELTIVIVIIGVITAATLSLIKPYYQQKRIDATRNAVRAMEGALNKYVSMNGNYPCPAGLKVPRGSSEDGVGICNADNAKGVYEVPAVMYSGRDASGQPVTSATTVLIGAVPWRSLNIAMDAALAASDQTGLTGISVGTTTAVGSSIDAYHNRITYAISKASTNDNTFDFTPVGDGKGSAAIRVIDRSGSSITHVDLVGNDNNENDHDAFHHYFLFSHGMNGDGAHSNGGTQISSCNTATTGDAENCDFDSTFFVNQDGEIAFNLGLGSNYYDDISSRSYNAAVVPGNNNSDDESLWARNETTPENIYNRNLALVGIGLGPTENPISMLHVKGSGGKAKLTIERDGKRMVFDPNIDNTNNWSNIELGVGMGLSISRDTDPAPNFYRPETFFTLNRDDKAANGSGSDETSLYLDRPGTAGLRLSVLGGNTTPSAGVLDLGLPSPDLSAPLRFSTNGNIAMNVQAAQDPRQGPGNMIGHVNIGLGAQPVEPGRILDVNRNIRIRNVNGIEWPTTLDFWHISNNHAPAISFYRARGEWGSATGAMAGDTMMSIDARSLIPANMDFAGAGLSVIATENHSAGRAGMKLVLKSVANTETEARDVLEVNENHQVKILGTADGEQFAPLEVTGGIKVGDQGHDCNSRLAGVLSYNASIKQMQFCDGNNWVNMAGP